MLPLLLLKLLLWKSCLKDQKDNIWLDEDGGERVWVLSYSLALHFEHPMLKSVQSFQ